MWTLFVISFVYATPDELELRYTRYKEFDSEWNCNIALEKLEKTFEDGEVATCYQTERSRADINGIY